MLIYLVRYLPTYSLNEIDINRYITYKGKYCLFVIFSSLISYFVSGRTRSRMLAPPLDPALESSPRTPRRQTRNRPSKTPSKSEAPADDVGSVKEAQFRTPSKRKSSTAATAGGAAGGDADDGVSPTKLSKSDAKLCAAAGSKENYVIGSPSVHLAKLRQVQNIIPTAYI